MTIPSSPVIEAWERSGYTDTIHLIAQQISGLLWATGMPIELTGKMTFFDALGESTMYQINTRFQSRTEEETPKFKRSIVAQHWGHDEPVDIIFDPYDTMMTALVTGGPIQQAAMAAIERKLDELFYLGMNGNATEWDADDETSVNIPFGNTRDETPAAIVVAGLTANTVTYNESTSATEGMTVAKWRKAKEALDALNASEGRRYIGWNSIHANQILADALATSTDYNTVRALVNGEINMYIGMEAIKSNQIASDIANIGGSGEVGGYVFCYTDKAMRTGFPRDIANRVNAQLVPQPDTVAKVLIHHRVSANATRADEKEVVRIECTNANGTI